MIGATRRMRWILAILLFALTLPAVATRPHSADEIEYFCFLRSLWFDHDLSFDNEYRYFADAGYTRDPQFRQTFLDAETATGLRPTFATIGAAIMWTPFYAVADAGVRVARLAGSPVVADGFSWPYLAAVAWGSACYGFLSLLLSASLARRLTGRGSAAAIAVALGTPLVYYMYAQPGFAHACSAFAVALLVWTWMRVRVTWSIGGVALVGALAALVTMVREQEAFVLIAPAADYAWTLIQHRDRRAIRDGVVRAAVAGAAFTIAFLPQAAAYIALHGRLRPSPVVANKMDWTAPWATRVVASPEHGWFFWSPLVVLALAGLVLMAVGREPPGMPARRTGLLLLVAVASQVYVSGSVATWTLAGAFGQRRFVGMTVCLVVGLAWLISRAAAVPTARALSAVAIVLTVWWNLGLAIQFGEHSMDRQRMEPLRNAYTTFVDVPVRLPSLVHRYLFDRASFYQSHSGSGG